MRFLDRQATVRFCRARRIGGTKQKQAPERMRRRPMAEGGTSTMSVWKGRTARRDNMRLNKRKPPPDTTALSVVNDTGRHGQSTAPIRKGCVALED